MKYTLKNLEDDLRKKNMLKQFYKCFDKICIILQEWEKENLMKNCFTQVLEDNELRAENTLFIDDSIQHIEGAKKNRN